MREGLKPYLDDNTQAWDMQPDGSFKRAKRGRAKAQVRADGAAEEPGEIGDRPLIADPPNVVPLYGN